MSIWNRIERALWTGDPVADYGLISDTSVRGTRRKVSVMLAGKQSRRVIIRVSYRRWFAGSLDFLDLDRESVTLLHAALEDALTRM